MPVANGAQGLERTVEPGERAQQKHLVSRSPVEPIRHRDLRDPRRNVTVLQCVVTGVDKAGIVARVSRTLADSGVNVTALSTQSRPEPESGTPIFTMRIDMAVPAGTDVRALRQRLERVADELHVELTLSDRPNED